MMEGWGKDGGSQQSSLSARQQQHNTPLSPREGPHLIMSYIMYFLKSHRKGGIEKKQQRENTLSITVIRSHGGPGREIKCPRGDVTGGL